MGFSEKKGFGQGTFMETRMLRSQAYLSLGVKGSLGKDHHVSGASIHIINTLLLKRQYSYLKKRKGPGKEYKRVDDNEFHLTYKELMSEPPNFTGPKITRGFDELLAKGFIKIVHAGGAYDKDKAVYALVEDYRNWKPGHQPIRTRKRDVKRGFQGKSTGKTKKTTNADVNHPHIRRR